jgi:hypothetical protein
LRVAQWDVEFPLFFSFADAKQAPGGSTTQEK